MKSDVAKMKLTPQPVLSSCYCSQCKRTLSDAGLVENDLAWCPTCKSLVLTTYLQVPAWVIGVVFVLFAELMFL